MADIFCTFWDAFAIILDPTERCWSGLFRTFKKSGKDLVVDEKSSTECRTSPTNESQRICKGIYTVIQTECHACIESWHLFGKLPDSMSLSSAFRNCLDKILVRGESPERPLSPRTKIMSNVRANRKFCAVKKKFSLFLRSWLDIIDYRK